MTTFEDDDDTSQGAPAWMATFADLMALMMCFFVLLLSFSEMDVLKFKQIAGSMNHAFGVQNQVKAKDIPKGTSVIAQEFSPGQTQLIPSRTVNQMTAQTTKQSLRVGSSNLPDAFDKGLNKEQTKRLLEEKLKTLVDETKADSEKLEKALSSEIEEGKIDIETDGRSITIRIRENGSFPSGSATLNPDFVPVMTTLRDALKEIEGEIAVEGHTDNIPIASMKFSSNWGLSSARALSVTHELIKDHSIDDTRFMVVGHADTKPYKPNTSIQNRAENRRVEIVIRQGMDDGTTTSIKNIKSPDFDVIETPRLNDESLSDNQNQ